MGVKPGGDCNIMSKGNYQDFVYHLGHRESNNTYDSVNTFGFMGRWQFGKARLYDLGYSINGYHPKGMPVKESISREHFLNNPCLQDIIMHKHIEDLKKTFAKKYSKYIGKIINNTKITLSGLIAGAHLKGLGGVNGFLKGKDNVDAFGTRISEYINKFGDYEVDSLPPIINGVVEYSDIPAPKPLENIEEVTDIHTFVIS